MELYKLESAIYTANVMYGLEMDSDTFLEMALIAWNRIGNKYYRLYRFQGKIDPNDLSVEIPCNADIIEAITYGFEDWEYVTNNRINGDTESQFTEHYIEARKIMRNPLYISGKLAKYIRTGNKIYFDNNYGTINVLYKGIYIDEDGLPMINEKEQEAIACFCAFSEKFKQGWAQNNPQLIEMAKLLEQDWKRLCDQARIPIQFSQNEMDEILTAKVSANRKQYNAGFKPYN